MEASGSGSVQINYGSGEDPERIRIRNTGSNLCVCGDSLQDTLTTSTVVLCIVNSVILVWFLADLSGEHFLIESIWYVIPYTGTGTIEASLHSEKKQSKSIECSLLSVD
jgi:hypothetical protein